MPLLTSCLTAARFPVDAAMIIASSSRGGDTFNGPAQTVLIGSSSTSDKAKNIVELRLLGVLADMISGRVILEHHCAGFNRGDKGKTETESFCEMVTQEEKIISD